MAVSGAQDVDRGTEEEEIVAKLLETPAWRTLKGLRHQRILLPYEGHRLCGDQNRQGDTKPIVVVNCGDGHRAPDFVHELRQATPCTHGLSFNGAGVVMDTEFSDPMMPSEDVAGFRRMVAYLYMQSMIIKGTNLGAMTAHLDCAAATYYGLDMFQVLESTVRAKEFLKQELPVLIARARELQRYPAAKLDALEGFKIATLTHVHNGPDLSVFYIDDMHDRFAHLRRAA